MGIKLKIFMALMALLVGRELSAQHYFGVKGGYGGGTARFEPQQNTNILWGLTTGGVSWRYYSREKFVGGVQADLEYMQRGYRIVDQVNPDTSYVRRVNSVVMPLCWQPHFYLFGRTLKAFINLGVTFSYNMDRGSTYSTESIKDGVLGSAPYNLELVRDNRWNFGLMGGAGLGLLFGRTEAFVEGRYYFGYGDILKNKANYEPNPYYRSPLDNITVTAGVYIRLGKGGILSPPSKKVAAKLESRREKRELEAMESRGKVINIDNQKQEKIENDGDNKTGQSGQTDTKGH